MESKINLAQVSPVNYKVTAALVNQFVVSTTQFLNRFASRCDKKLQQVGTNMHRIETTLNILEAKLASISGIASSAAARPVTQSISAAQSASQAASPPGQAAAAIPAAAAAPEPAAAPPQPPAQEVPPLQPKRKVKDDPRFGKYFKMVKVGVPAAAAKGKMVAEGLDPNVLDMDPDAEAPPGGDIDEHNGEQEESQDTPPQSDDEYSD